ncbi:1-deoxy-D-xylulose-5-phosphate reductoisomerase [Amaricoccus solimangrovi]|uniref:1-deoxy-D-xylulose 5-phosphate reductoisomerase n=1 Tax=Amaricoccus solimangrovi TaxID=2589815 RepID=A0A501WWA4_9RHOB|nr:1-deoxy-D-xylulose-5-phosphate reductoisomerase [Amaricoccus solimangrovi]TPE53559.1 1-deoxy-D-xylulose-5-phosphate reductoisomerase [Amaricoccus solimangrovi]
MRRKVSVFGATGSVGRNTIAVLEEQGGAEAFEVVALSGAGNVALLAEQARRLSARLAVTGDPARLGELRAALEGSGIEAAAGPAALLAAASEPVDWTMSAIVGAAGLSVSLRAAGHGGVLALANKESLVCAGELLRATCARHDTKLVPVDSEHSAIFQALRGEESRAVERVILTASGGPFRDWTRERMATVTPAQARAHPNWSMGERISIDSATMFNKAMEMIEARELFDLAPDQIEVIIHPQSIVHSMVGFNDGSIMAQLGPSDMRGAIGFALNWPERRPLALDRLDFAALARLDFAAADPVRFPALRLARAVMREDGLSGAVFNAAKEAALDAFLIGAIGFLDMAILVEHVLDKLAPEAAQAGTGYDLEAVLDLDTTARRMSGLWVAAYSGGR